MGRGTGSLSHVGDERGDLRRPADELRRHACLRRRRVGEVDGREPLLRTDEDHVRVQDVMRFAVRQDALAGSEGEERSTPDGLRAGEVALVGVRQVGLDVRGAEVLGPGVGHERPHLRPGSVGADEQARGDRRSVVEGDLVLSAIEGADAGDLAAPLDGVLGQRLEQDASQLTARDLGASAAARVFFVEEDGGRVGRALRVASPPAWMMARSSSKSPAARSASCPLFSWMSSIPPCVRADGEASASRTVAAMPCTWSTRARTRPPSPAPMMVMGCCRVASWNIVPDRVERSSRAVKSGGVESPTSRSRAVFLCNPSRVIPSVFAVAVLLFWWVRSASMRSQRSSSSIRSFNVPALGRTRSMVTSMRRRRGERSSGVMKAPGSTWMTRRWTSFCSSRTLPGQS